MKEDVDSQSAYLSKILGQPVVLGNKLHRDKRLPIMVKSMYRDWELPTCKAIAPSTHHVIINGYLDRKKQLSSPRRGLM